MRETWLRSLGWKDPLQKEDPYSSILAWRIPRTVQSMGSKTVGRDWATFTTTCNSVRSLSHIRLFQTPARQASLSITNAQSLLKFMSIESVMPSNHLILCRPLLLPPSIFPSIGVFSNKSVFFFPPISQFFASGGQSFGVSASALVLPMNIQDWFPLEWTGWISLQSKGFSRVFSNTTVQKHQFFGTQLSSQSNSHIHTWSLEKP